MREQPCAYVFMCMSACLSAWVSTCIGAPVGGCPCVGSHTCEHPHLMVLLSWGEAGSTCGNQDCADLGHRHPG